ncbi:MAG: 2-C-methyl-D-erythritol 4-phosphate cytidylyltransferase [Acidobacteria bacterium]|nr:2-C-methyl-D-erythritol 4-phosphate cytidylyltransferase [Acidobacteriota bacterium]
MHADRAKQMLELGGVPLLVHTLRRFEACDAVDQVILVLQPNLTSEVLSLLPKHHLKKIVRVVAGGAERQDSVYRGLQVVNGETAGIVLVHDAARPFIKPEEIRAVIERAETKGAAILASPAVDTIKQVKQSTIRRTLNRQFIYYAQTPQAFQYAILKTAYDQAFAESYRATDDAQLVERAGHQVSIIEGSPINIKITRPFDLKIAEVIHKEFFG